MASRLKIYFETLRHLTLRQIVWQLRHRIYRRRYVIQAEPCAGRQYDLRHEAWLRKPESYLGSGCYRFLNVEYIPQSGADISQGMLWAYNYHYMDYLLQPGLGREEALRLIDSYIAEISEHNPGMDAYPTSLRCLNWMKWMLENRDISEEARDRINVSLRAQYRHLERNPEWHLSGNHLLENAMSLVIGSVYFEDRRMYARASSLLKRELEEQILADGGHYEQSEMYHNILLDRLLDVYNVLFHNPERADAELTDMVRAKALLMTGHMLSMAYKTGGGFPLFGDSAEGIAPETEAILKYAERLGLQPKAIALRDSGFRKIETGGLECFICAGGVTAKHQPGHRHSDMLSYEIRYAGVPCVVDTGVSTYEKTERRQYERSSRAHNTVTHKGEDMLAVWGGFRAAGRPKVKLLTDSAKEILASAEREYLHTRHFKITDDGVLEVADTLQKKSGKTGLKGTCRIHLSPDDVIETETESRVVTRRIEIEIKGAEAVRIEDCRVARRWNRLEKARVVVMEFRGNMKYSIKGRTEG